jgi:hypothetical protein
MSVEEMITTAALFGNRLKSEGNAVGRSSYLHLSEKAIKLAACRALWSLHAA